MSEEEILELSTKVGAVIGRLLNVLLKKNILSQTEFDYITEPFKEYNPNNKEVKNE